MAVPAPEGTAVAVYPVMGEAPMLRGAVKLTWPVEETAMSVGMSGVRTGAVNVTGADAGEVPLLLVATKVT